MRLVIEASDFQRLSLPTRRELVEKLAGKDTLSATDTRGSTRPRNLLWREPFDLTPELATRLMHGISESHRVRLKLFATRGGRVRQSELLAVTGDTDMKVLSHFQGAMSRRLRRMINDPDRRLHLIGWDYAATKWNDDHTEIVDGIYYLTEKTTRALQGHFGLKKGRRKK